jgi:glycolate oxidase FAD binding subunit
LLDTVAKMAVLTPGSEDEAAAAVREAHGRREPLRIEGGGTQAGMGRPLNTTATLSSAGLTGITLHEPAELVISARAGTPLREVEEKLASAGQCLPFEPINLRPLYGSSGEPTVGGIVAGNWSGPRRVAAGAARDHLIGVRFVNGRGEVIKSGGRVMKNVTGLDLVKLQCGAFGTLGFLTEATFKVLPKPPATTTLVYEGLDDRRGIDLLSAALTSPFEVSGAAHLPASATGGPARTLLRLENFPASLDYRCDRLAGLTVGFGQPARLDEAASLSLWRDIRDGRFLAEPRDCAVWRVSVPPTKGAELVAHLPAGLVAAHFYDWGGGLVWIAVGAAEDAGAAAIRATVARTGGHATLLRAADALRSVVPVFQPLAEPVMALTRRVKASLDPHGILNAGRMYSDV